MWRFAALGMMGLRYAGVGQEQSFEQPNIGHEFASFIKVIASIEDPAVIQKILAHLDDKATTGARF
jgi:hypothetical protein